MSPEAKKFFLDSKDLIKQGDFKSILTKISLHPNDWNSWTKEVRDILKEVGVDLKDYFSFNVGDKVEIVDIGLIYSSYTEFFIKNNYPKEWLDNYIKNDSFKIKKGDAGIVLAKEWHQSRTVPLYVIEVDRPTPEGIKPFIYLISQHGLKLIEEY